MKRTALFIALALTASAAVAADPKPQASPSQKSAATPPAAATPGAAPAIDAASARAELAELRTQMQDLSRRMATLSGELGDVGPRSYAYRYLGNPDRGLIGIVVARDGRDLRVTAVTPGGPAERAGIKNGDLIIKVRGDLEGPSQDTAKFLNEALRNLKAGQEVKLTLQRAGKPIDVTVKAERREPYNFAEAFVFDGDNPLPPDVEKHIRESTEAAMREAQRATERAQMNQDRARQAAERASEQAQRALSRMHGGMPWWGLNLATLNPELGRYFGTDKGVLVISADAGSLPGLRGGDVITSVAGEPVTRSEDALRALRDQPAGKDVAIKLLRDRKTLALNMQTPAFKSIFPAPPPPPPGVPAAPTVRALPATPATPATPVTPATPATPAAETGGI